MSMNRTEIIARAIIRSDENILLVRQRGRSWSFLPGGHVEPGESVEHALVRELAEELGSEAEIDNFAGAVEHGYLEDGVMHHELNLVFRVTLSDREPVSQEGHLEFHWLPVDQLSTTDIRPAPLKRALAASDRQVPFWHGSAVGES